MNCILMLDSLGLQLLLTVYCSRSTGVAADTSAREYFYGGASKGQNVCQIKHPAPALPCRAGKGKKHIPAEEDGIMLKCEEIQSH